MATNPWPEVIALLSDQLAELAQEDPDPTVLDHLQTRIHALEPALQAPPPPGEAAAYLAFAHEAARLTTAVGAAAAQRRHDLSEAQRAELSRARGLAAYRPAPVDDARFVDRRS